MILTCESLASMGSRITTPLLATLASVALTSPSFALQDVSTVVGIPPALAVVEQTRFSNDGQFASVELDIVNRATVTITAWQAMVDYSLSDGTRGRVGVLRDQYELAGDPASSGALSSLSRKRETVRFKTPPGVLIESARAEIVLLVFEDGTRPSGSSRT